MFTKSMPKTVKMTVKGGAAVDPDSGNTLLFRKLLHSIMHTSQNTHLRFQTMSRARTLCLNRQTKTETTYTSERMRQQLNKRNFN